MWLQAPGVFSVRNTLWVTCLKVVSRNAVAGAVNKGSMTRTKHEFPDFNNNHNVLETSNLRSRLQVSLEKGEIYLGLVFYTWERLLSANSDSSSRNSQLISLGFCRRRCKLGQMYVQFFEEGQLSKNLGNSLLHEHHKKSTISTARQNDYAYYFF